MTYGHLQADCLYTGISSEPNARCRVWEAFTFYLMGVQIPKDEGLSFLPSWGKVRCISLCLSKNVPISIVVLTYLDKSLNMRAWLKVNNDSLVVMGM